MKKPDYITQDLLNLYKKDIQIGGLLMNQEKPSSPLSKELLEDIKSTGFTYIITNYTQDRKGQDNLNSLIETLSNADEVGIDVIVSFRVFAKTETDKTVIRDREREYWWYADNFSEEKLLKAKEYTSFKGVFFDEPGDSDTTYENLKAFYNTIKKHNVKVDINLFPNYSNIFSADDNKWGTGRNFREYIERYAQISDSIGVDFYPINYGNDYYISDNKLHRWLECLETLLHLHHKYPEKDYKLFIQASKHSGYGELTSTTFNMQLFACLIAGCNDVRLFCLTDNDAKEGTAKFECSPYTSDHTGYKHGTSYDIVKFTLNSSIFKSLVELISSIYIENVDIYQNKKPLLGTIEHLDELVNLDSGKLLVSVGYDKSFVYCFIVNIDLKQNTYISFSTSDWNLLPEDCMIVTNPYREEIKKPNIFKRFWNWIKRLFGK